MTTNKTIDGVPRELLERITRAGIWQREVKELRALLDAPACSACNDTGRMHEPGCEPGACTACLEKPAAQPQGEPVAWQFYQDGKWWNGMDQNRHKENTIEAGYLVRDLYAEQPAPVAPVAQPGFLLQCMDDEFKADKKYLTKGMCDCNQGRIPCNGKCAPTI